MWLDRDFPLCIGSGAIQREADDASWKSRCSACLQNVTASTEWTFI